MPRMNAVIANQLIAWAISAAWKPEFFPNHKTAKTLNQFITNSKAIPVPAINAFFPRLGFLHANAIAKSTIPENKPMQDSLIRKTEPPIITWFPELCSPKALASEAASQFSTALKSVMKSN